MGSVSSEGVKKAWLMHSEEFSDTAIIQEFTDGGAAFTKGDVVNQSHLQRQVPQMCKVTHRAGNAPYAVQLTPQQGKGPLCCAEGR